MRYSLITLIVVAQVLSTVGFVSKNQANPQAPPQVQVPRPYDPGIVEPIKPESKPEKKEYVPEFVKVPSYGEPSEDSIYGDVMSHTHRPWKKSNRNTNVHETAHGITSYLVNKYTKKLGKQMNGFYALDGKGVVIEEPNLKLSTVARFVPQNLRASRYNLYLIQQPRSQPILNGSPLYLCDEWNAYILDSMCSVEDVRNGRNTMEPGTRRNGVLAPLEFSIYSIALCMAVEKHDPDYWKNNKQFRKFIIWNLKRSQKVFEEGRNMEQFKWKAQERLLHNFRNASYASSMRDFTRKHLQGIWLEKKVIDF